VIVNAQTFDGCMETWMLQSQGEGHNFSFVVCQCHLGSTVIAQPITLDFPHQPISTPRTCAERRWIFGLYLKKLAFVQTAERTGTRFIGTLMQHWLVSRKKPPQAEATEGADFYASLGPGCGLLGSCEVIESFELAAAQDTR
jgi:hypothetical protein